MIFHSCVGDWRCRFDKSVKDFMAKFGRKIASVADFEAVQRKIMATNSLRSSRNGLRKPRARIQDEVHRLSRQKGFRVVGEITQDLDLFRKPLELKVDTDGQNGDETH